MQVECAPADVHLEKWAFVKFSSVELRLDAGHPYLQSELHVGFLRDICWLNSISGIFLYML